MNVEAHHTTKELQTLYRTEKNARLAQRIHGVYWANRAYVGYDDLRFAAIEA